MKKYINKLFEWLGYIPKEIYEDAVMERDHYRDTAAELKHDNEAHDVGVKNGNIIYHYVWFSKMFIVMGYCAETNYHQYIKAFRYHDSDSEAYARICAEELCEMLNEKH